MTELIVKELIASLAPVVGALFTGLVSLALMWLKNYIKARTNNVLVENAMARISNTAETVVAHISQTVVDGIKSAAADGKLSKEDGVFFKRQAIELVKSQIPTLVLNQAKMGTKNLDFFVGMKIEQAVSKQKTVPRVTA